jgi:hypothetical protein
MELYFIQNARQATAEHFVPHVKLVSTNMTIHMASAYLVKISLKILITQIKLKTLLCVSMNAIDFVKEKALIQIA